MFCNIIAFKNFNSSSIFLGYKSDQHPRNELWIDYFHQHKEQSLIDTI